MLNFDWLSGISQESAKNIFYGLFLIIGILVLTIPNTYVFKGLEKEEVFWWKNLKIWALLVLSTLVYVYYRF